ncbi:MAE_28990/MAE_18760 family HEPN-like nuclease [Poriferisphaera sp. WC338]|uniref:MAE_28990/MAE_18760 family HEPN-like nuclease n=1 Tax=Poriferisphaera sp. WC338 TaxID=3425129 RepID=UPI003D8156F9
MTSPLNTLPALEKTLQEVEILLAEAEGFDEDRKKLVVLNKAAFLLLVGKFEAYIENLVEEFVFAINSLELRAAHVPERLLAEHSVQIVKNVKDHLNNGKLEKVNSMFIDLSRYWAEIEPCNSLNISNKFSYGKHGEKELIKMFKRCGIESIFDEIVLYDPQEKYDSNEDSVLDIKGIFNSITNMRNNILHQDETPTLTVGNVKYYKNILVQLAECLEELLQKIISNADSKRQKEGMFDYVI